MNWSEMKAKVEHQMQTDPQRGTLASRAAQSVEEGLRHLASVGYGFEIAPRGTLAQLVELQEPPPPTRPLTIVDANGLVKAPARPAENEFEARKTA